MKTNLKFRNAVVFALPLVLASVFALNFCGCTAAQIAQAKAARDQTVAARAGADQTIADLKGQIDQLPAGDKLRASLESLLAKAQAGLAQLDKAIPIADGLIHAAETKDPADPTLTAALRTVPYGVYITFALTAIGLLVRNGQLAKTRDSLASLWQAFTQTVQSVEAALPTKTPEQKLAMSAVQDESTRQLVDQAKVTA